MSMESTTTGAPAASKRRYFLRYLSAALIVLVLAVSVGLSRPKNLRILHLRFSLPPRGTFFHKVFVFLKQASNSKQTLIPISQPMSQNQPCLLWMAPFLSGGGYSSEAWSYISALHHYNLRKPSFRLGIYQHGDLESLEFWEGLPQDARELAVALYRTGCAFNETIVVCHSEPGAWNPPLFDTTPCPPAAYDSFMAVIGRTMFETDSVNEEHVKRCNRMDYVWVPTEFHVNTFVNSGVEAKKVVKVVQAVDVSFFDPSKYQALDLNSVGQLILGSGLRKENVFVFLSVFKWEYRKGWDVLLSAYLKEFSGDDDVVLYLLTNPYHSDRNFGNKIVDFVRNSGLEKPVGGWAPIYVMEAHIAQAEFPRLYRSANAFVLPSRGEGWGRPLVEAMAMSLPVIATNWSGPTEYLTEENGYPLTVDRMSEVTQGPFKGHFWAEPSADHLRVLMRHIMSDVEDGKRKGMKAREDMIKHFSPEIVARIVTNAVQAVVDNSI
uniref:Glycosyl transferase family 1 domain-containing protein n=1 Tax=Kalanchoe fedtschenkoi TaxID=63787 RepID=A0A7N0T5Z8_KALFE